MNLGDYFKYLDQIQCLYRLISQIKKVRFVIKITRNVLGMNMKKAVDIWQYLIVMYW